MTNSTPDYSEHTENVKSRPLASLWLADGNAVRLESVSWLLVFQAWTAAASSSGRRVLSCGSCRARHRRLTIGNGPERTAKTSSWVCVCVCVRVRVCDLSPLTWSPLCRFAPQKRPSAAALRSNTHIQSINVLSDVRRLNWASHFNSFETKD